MHPVGFTPEARRDVLEFLPDPDAQDTLVVAIIDSLEEFPRAHHRCPSKFGARARCYVEGDFTIVYDVDSADPPGEAGAQVAVRHVWPSRSEQVSGLVSALKSHGLL